MALSWWHLRKDSGIWVLDKETLRVEESYPGSAPGLPDELLQPQMDDPDMEIHTHRSRDDAGAERCALVWETLPRKRATKIPLPSILRLCVLTH